MLLSGNGLYNLIPAAEKKQQFDYESDIFRLNFCSYGCFKKFLTVFAEYTTNKTNFQLHSQQFLKFYYP
jgi:hypothetical protein